MTLSPKSRYALKALTALANTSGQAVPLAYLAKQKGLPAPFMEQVFATLRAHSLVKSLRGAGGGYRLARPAAAITLWEIVKLFEAASESQAQESCACDALLAELETLLKERLESETLAHLAQKDLYQQAPMYYI